MNPTDSRRTFDASQIKPNVFSSIFAYYALKATGAEFGDNEARFFDWLERIRNDKGYWISASGSQIPFGQNKAWASTINIRHCAKVLDLYLLKERFYTSDVDIFKYILSAQYESGAFPQTKDGQADLWSSAYVVNLLIRAMFQKNLSLTMTRGYTLQSWTPKRARQIS